MSSLRKIQANRANARASTGPRTAPGRARAARNALRHGLSLSVFADPTQSEQVETLAREITGEPAGDDIYELARRVAEAQVDLQRVRNARHQVLADRLNNRYYESGASAREKISVIRNLLRPRAPEIPVVAPAKYLNMTPQGPHKVATILLQEAQRLQAMDRYERRALSRRRFAIRALDRARGDATRRNIVL
jgi:hypothetical protein